MIHLTEDKLKRTELLNNLFGLFDNFGNYDDGGLTISINGKYGSGKSTLLNFIKEKNEKDNKYHVVKYDAWKNNFFENPLIPLLNSLNELETNSSHILDGAKKIIKSLPQVFTKTLANVHGVDLSPLLANENIFEDYKKYSESIMKYKSVLTDFCNSKKVILLIDELDRCLPEYQIKVLETLYNIFNIPNLILVIALDKEQLNNSIKQIFGENSDVSGYLSKFIQYEIDLPVDQNNQYIKSLLLFNCKYIEIKDICSKLFEIAEVSIRDSLHIVKELNLICNEKNKDGDAIIYKFWYPIFVCLVLIIKKKYRNIYKKYFYNEKGETYMTESIPLDKTIYFEFLSDIKNTDIEKIIRYFLSLEMGFSFILYFINYFHFIEHINIDSLVEYTGYTSNRVQRIIDGIEIQMWEPYKFNETIKKIKILR